jgi:hypothetical protein
VRFLKNLSLTAIVLIGIVVAAAGPTNDQSVPNVDALKAIPSTQSKYIHRQGFATPGDGGGAFYRPSTLPCPLNAGAGDNGSQVLSVNGKCWLIEELPEYDVRIWGAKCDGVAVDTVALTAAFASDVKSFTLPPARTCLASNLTTRSQQILNGRGSYIQAPSGSAGKWILKRTGAYNKLLHTVLSDPSSFTEVTTTLSSVVAAGTTNLPVVSSANMAVGMATVTTLASGIKWPSVITAIPDSTHVTIKDATPNTATGVTVATGGSGNVQADPVVALRGTGLNAPLTLEVGVSFGVVNVGLIMSPGLYTTPPANPVSVQNTGSPRARNATFNVTWESARSGAVVAAGWPILMNSGTFEGTVSDFRIPFAPFGMGWNIGTELQSEGDQIENFQLNNITRMGFFKGVDVNTMAISHGMIWGTAPTFGGVGIYWDDGTPGVSVATGGNRMTDVVSLQWDIGAFFQASTLGIFNAFEVDTNNYYGAILNSNTSMTLAPLYAAFTGPNTGGVVNGYGVGVHVGNGSTNVGFGLVQQGGEASDINVDPYSSIHLGTQNGDFTVGHRLTGDGAGIYSGQQTLVQNYGSLTTGVSPIFLGMKAGTEGDALWRNMLYASTVTRVTISSDTAPTVGHFWAARLRIGLADTDGQCSWTGNSSFGCDITVPMQIINPAEAVSIALTSDIGLTAKFTLGVKQQ